MSNLGISWPTNETFPVAIVSPWLLEEYWALKKIEDISQRFPRAHWDGLIASTGTWDEIEIGDTPTRSIPTFSKYKGQKLIEHDSIPKTFEDSVSLQQSLNAWVNSKQLIGTVCLSTSHTTSLYRYKAFQHKFPDIRVITVDTHLDLAENYGSNRWIENPSQVGIITPRVDTPDARLFGWRTRNLMDIFNSSDAYDFLRGRPVFLSIDLDFFQHFSSYRHRKLLIGHSMTISQRIDLYAANESKTSDFIIGEETKVFQSLETHKNSLKKGVYDDGVKLRRFLVLFLSFLASLSSFLVGVDICEYSPICDLYQATAWELKEAVGLVNGYFSQSRYDDLH